MLASKSAYLLTVFTIICWGGAASAFKLALLQLTPQYLLAFSALVSWLVLSALMIITRKYSHLRTLKISQWSLLLLLGAANPFLYYMVLFEAYYRLPGQIAMTLNYLWPVMLVILSVPVLNHRLRFTNLVSILLSFFGALLIASNGDFSGWNQLDATGVLLVLFSTVIWALYWLISARLQIDAVIKLWIGFISGTVLTWLYIMLSDEAMPAFIHVPWIAIAYVGMLEMGLTFFVWLKALQLAPNTATIANLIYLTPFVSLMLLSLILHESIYPTTIIGLVIIIGGILLQQYRHRTVT